MNTLAPVGSLRRIPYPNHTSEFEVQAHLFGALRSAGLDVRGEVKTLFESKRKGEKAKHCRFDLVLFRQQTPVEVFEVKADTVKHKSGVMNTRQGQRYTTFGVPVTFVYGMADAEKVISRLADTKTTEAS